MATIDTRPGCRNPKCKNRAIKSGYCSDHQSHANDRHHEYNKFKRDPKKVAVYNSYKWKQTRRRILEKYPLCTRCQALGKYTGAQMVDHLVGFTDKEDPHAWDELYLYPLCNLCHGIVTGKEKHTNFLNMSLVKAIYLKYDGADPHPSDVSIYL